MLHGCQLCLQLHVISCLLAPLGFDPAENELLKVCQLPPPFLSFCKWFCLYRLAFIRPINVDPTFRLSDEISRKSSENINYMPRPSAGLAEFRYHSS